MTGMMGAKKQEWRYLQTTSGILCAPDWSRGYLSVPWCGSDHVPRISRLSPISPWLLRNVQDGQEACYREYYLMVVHPLEALALQALEPR